MRINYLFFYCVNAYKLLVQLGFIVILNIINVSHKKYNKYIDLLHFHIVTNYTYLFQRKNIIA